GLQVTFTGPEGKLPPVGVAPTAAPLMVTLQNPPFALTRTSPVPPLLALPLSLPLSPPLSGGTIAFGSPLMSLKSNFLVSPCLPVKVKVFGTKPDALTTILCSSSADRLSIFFDDPFHGWVSTHTLGSGTMSSSTVTLPVFILASMVFTAAADA